MMKGKIIFRKFATFCGQNNERSLLLQKLLQNKNQNNLSFTQLASKLDCNKVC